MGGDTSVRRQFLDSRNRPGRAASDEPALPSAGAMVKARVDAATGGPQALERETAVPVGRGRDTGPRIHQSQPTEHERLGQEPICKDEGVSLKPAVLGMDRFEPDLAAECVGCVREADDLGAGIDHGRRQIIGVALTADEGDDTPRSQALTNQLPGQITGHHAGRPATGDRTMLARLEIGAGRHDHGGRPDLGAARRGLDQHDPAAVLVRRQADHGGAGTPVDSDNGRAGFGRRVLPRPDPRARGR